MIFQFGFWLISGVGNEEVGGVEEWRTSVIERVIAEESGENSSLILAAKRTKRKDPNDNFKFYTGGWNISNSHYLTVSLYFCGPNMFFFCCVKSLSFQVGYASFDLGSS